jgi:ABC-type multidrug transport system fused ATPase/permease subunit
VNSSIRVYSKLFNKLEKRDKSNFFLLLVIIILSSFLEVMSFGAVMPFIAALSNPLIFNKYVLLKRVILFLDLKSNTEIIYFFSIAFFSAIVVSTILKLILLKYTTKYTYNISSKFSFSIYERVLFQPYIYHTTINSGDIISNITIKVSTLTSVLNSLLIVVTNIFVVLILSFSLLMVEPKLILISLASVLFVYALISIFYKNRLKANSYKISDEQNSLIKIIQEGLGAIREVILSSNQNFYLNLFSRSNKKLKISLISNHFIGHSPKIIMEAVLITLIGCLAIVSNNRPGGIASALPILGLIAIAGQRLMPAIQVIFQNWTNIISSKASIEEVIEILEKPIEIIDKNNDNKLNFNTNIIFENVCFYYETSQFKEKRVLDNISLIIPKGSRIGFVGTTGSGKSTLVDIIMGLLVPQSGNIWIDQELLQFKNMRCWQKNIANVPQSIFLTDGTIAENVAFGVPPESINYDKVYKSLSRAGLQDFINQNRKGVDIEVGERGIRLSGGQKQRIGIARALYRGSEILVFDEATSALDNETEKLILETINNLDKELTVIIIAHRTSTLANCDKIFKLKNGSIDFEGNYQDLVKNLEVKK